MVHSFISNDKKRNVSKRDTITKFITIKNVLSYLQKNHSISIKFCLKHFFLIFPKYSIERTICYSNILLLYQASDISDLLIPLFFSINSLNPSQYFSQPRQYDPGKIIFPLNRYFIIKSVPTYVKQHISLRFAIKFILLQTSLLHETTNIDARPVTVHRDVFSKLSGPIPLLPIVSVIEPLCIGEKKRKRQRKRERQRGKKKLITRTSESVSENKRVFLIRHLDKYKAFVTRVSESFYSFLLFFQPSILSLPLFFFFFVSTMPHQSDVILEKERERETNVEIRRERCFIIERFALFYFIFKIFHCAFSKKEMVRFAISKVHIAK